MLMHYFQLSEQPFGDSPDPRFLFETEAHREALASLLYGLSSGVAFITLIANPGMGKTTLLYETLRRIHSTTKTVFLVQPIPSPTALLQLLLTEMGVPGAGKSLVEMQLELNALLMQLHLAGKRLILVIDEAQNLSDDVLEAVRMLSNFETAQQKLIQIVLSGQPGLANTLRLPRFSQLRQRISIFAGLRPLSPHETACYIEHRLTTAGCPAATSLFTRSALAMIAATCDGTPRIINKVCFNALTIACALQQQHITRAVIREALSDSGVTTPSDTFFSEFGGEQHPGRCHSNRRPTEASRVSFSSIAARITSRSKHHSGPRVALAASAAGLIVALFSWLALLDYRAITAEDSPYPAISIAAYRSPESRSQVNPVPTSSSKQSTSLALPGKPSQSSDCSNSGVSKRCEQGEEGDLKQ
jgi:type II secretory pathway predicted ATPase ExeA